MLKSCVLLVLLGTICLPVSAQVASAELSGTILDSSGAAIPGAKVTAKNAATNVAHDTVTDATGAAVPKAAVTITNEASGLKWKATTEASGFYLVTNLPVGTYDVAVEAQGFAGYVEVEIFSNNWWSRSMNQVLLL